MGYSQYNDSHLVFLPSEWIFFLLYIRGSIDIEGSCSRLAAILYHHISKEAWHGLTSFLAHLVFRVKSGVLKKTNEEEEGGPGFVYTGTCCSLASSIEGG